MKNKKKIAYWLLLTVVLYTAGMVLSVGESQARYVNTASWYTIAEPTRAVVTSDCLADQTQPPLTVLLGQLEQPEQVVSFQLDSTVALSGKLVWTVDQPEYLNVTVRIGSTTLSSGDVIGLSAHIPVTVTMTLSPTEQAAQPRDAMDVNIRMTWRDSLTGTFRVELPQILPEEPTEPEPTESEPTEPEPTESEPTEPESTEPEPTESEPTEPEPTEPEPTEPDSTEPEPTGTEPSEPDSSEPDSNEPEPTGTESTEPALTELEPTEGENTEDETNGDPPDNYTTEETTTTEPPQPQPAVLLQTVAAYNPGLTFPVRITTDLDTQVYLGVVTEELFRGFPPGTRFSLDNGGSWYMLYEEQPLQHSVLSAAPVDLVLDLSRTTLAAEPSVTITAEGGTPVTLTADTAAPFQASARVLTAEKPLVMTLNNLWKDWELHYSLELLTATETGKAYVPVTLSAESLSAALTAGETGEILTLSIGQILPPPGTYRLSLSRTLDGICFGQTQFTFFINYAANTESEQTGGAEQ